MAEGMNSSSTLQTILFYRLDGSSFRFITSKSSSSNEPLYCCSLYSRNPIPLWSFGGMEGSHQPPQTAGYYTFDYGGKIRFKRDDRESRHHSIHSPSGAKWCRIQRVTANRLRPNRIWHLLANGLIEIYLKFLRTISWTLVFLILFILLLTIHRYIDYGKSWS